MKRQFSGRRRIVVLVALLFVEGAAALFLYPMLKPELVGTLLALRPNMMVIDQTREEMEQFQEVFARHVAGDLDVTIEVVQDRLARARSRVPALLRDPNDVADDPLTGFERATAITAAAFEEVDRTLGDGVSFRNNQVMLQRVDDLLAEPSILLRQLATDIRIGHLVERRNTLRSVNK